MRKLTKLKADAIDSRIMAKTAKAIWQELEREAEMLRRVVAKVESKVLVCVMLLVFIGGCNMVNGAFEDGAWLLEKAAENTEVQEK